jgi:uncharacterized membrane protein
MKSKSGFVLAFLLAISLGFNIFFASGFFSTKADLRQAKTLLGRAEFVANALRLSGEQREAFRRLREELFKIGREIKARNRELIESFWQEILKDQPDSLKIEEALSHAAAARREFAALAVEKMREFLRMLDQDQRQACLELIRKYVFSLES